MRARVADEDRFKGGPRYRHRSDRACSSLLVCARRRRCRLMPKPGFRMRNRSGMALVRARDGRQAADGGVAGRLKGASDRSAVSRASSRAMKTNRFDGASASGRSRRGHSSRIRHGRQLPPGATRSSLAGGTACSRSLSAELRAVGVAFLRYGSTTRRKRLVVASARSASRSPRMILPAANSTAGLVSPHPAGARRRRRCRHPAAPTLRCGG